MPRLANMRAIWTPANPPPSGSGCAIERAASRVLRNASTLEMSGSGAPARTTTPMPTRAKSIRPPGAGQLVLYLPDCPDGELDAMARRFGERGGELLLRDRRCGRGENHDI